MKRQFSAGIVIYTNAPDRQYLVLHYTSGHWDFPKGKIERNESKVQAAIRELQEETGITQVRIIPGFERRVTYFFKQEGTLVSKTVYFFIGYTQQTGIILSAEHIGYSWLPYSQALARITYKNAQELLEEVDRFVDADTTLHKLTG